MKTTYKLSLQTATSIALIYDHLRAAQQLCRDLVTDKETPQGVKVTSTAIAADIRGGIDRIERSVPQVKQEAFKEHIKDVDPLVFANVQHLFSRMTAEQKNILEQFADDLVHGKVQVEYSQA